MTYILEIEKIGERSLQGQLLSEMTMTFTPRTGAVFTANRENPVGARQKAHAWGTQSLVWWR